MPKILRQSARSAVTATRWALTGGLCVGLLIVPPLADSMPSAAYIVGIYDAGDVDDPEEHRGRLATCRPRIPSPVLLLLKPVFVVFIEPPSDPLRPHLFAALVPHTRGPPSRYVDSETRLPPAHEPFSQTLFPKV